MLSEDLMDFVKPPGRLARLMVLVMVVYENVLSMNFLKEIWYR